ncbi:DNA alkylation repair protein [Pollutibacter soli]|uniref:DNA alkylation repair protein n=1 Tax=Pollutibacter soli TaxID=3034157 RepID=UPI003013EAB6
MARKSEAPKNYSVTKPQPLKAEPRPKEPTAAYFEKRLRSYQSNTELAKIQRYFKTGKGDYGDGDKFIGVRMGQLFEVAKAFTDMPAKELEKLLESNVHELRAGAMSIMDKIGRNNKTAESRRKELFDLYIKRHDRINNWDLVDLAAIHIVGRYLDDKPRKILYKLAGSKNMWERRTAIVSTAYFLKKKDTRDTFAIAELLVKDKEDLVHKASGGWIRQAGKSNPKALIEFLDKHAATMPRTMLRYSVELLDKKKKEYYMGLAKN